GLVYRLRSVGWIEAWVHTRLGPSDCHGFLPYCYRKPGKTFGEPPLLLPPCPTDPRRSDRTAITVWRTPLTIAALPNRSTPERQNCDNSLANPPYYCRPAQQIHAGATELP
uniref:Uncharacterized protein n=1 Tax=Glossina palpalis gambiensis TaxID=67801 RepID=A0A1B0C284_9MUSC